MKTKLLTLLAIGLAVVAVAVSCSRSPAPSNAPTRTLAVSEVNAPLFGPEVTATTEITKDNLTTPTPLIPGDLYRPKDNAIDHAQAAKFAWLEFIAAVSPAKPNPSQVAGTSPWLRGVPGNSFISSAKGGSSSTPLVWETYQHRSELFPANAQTGGVNRPQPWESTPNYVYSPQPSPSPGADYTLFNNLDEASQIFQNHLFFPNPTQGQPPYQVLFEAKGNQLENQYLTKNYPLPNPLPSPTGPNPTTLYDGNIEIKAAWRPVASIPADQLYRYHVANVITYGGTNDNPVAKNEQYALIGLHIIHKTKNYPSFIFATFEQVDQYVNQVTKQPSGVFFQTLYPGLDQPPPATPTPLPTPPGYQYGAYYFAVDPSGYSAPGTQPSPQSNPSTFTATASPVRVFDTNKPMAWPNGKQYTSPNGTGFYPEPIKQTDWPSASPTPFSTPIPVTLPPTGNDDVVNVNKQVMALISSLNLGQDFVWQYYQLTGVQAIPTSDETTKDYYLANIVVESSQAGIQLFRGGLGPNPSFQPEPNIRNKFNVIDALSGRVSMGGCMGCHGAAQGAGGDFSFLVSTGQSGFSVDAIQDHTIEEAIRNAKARRALIKRSSSY